MAEEIAPKKATLEIIIGLPKNDPMAIKGQITVDVAKQYKSQGKAFKIGADENEREFTVRCEHYITIDAKNNEYIALHLMLLVPPRIRAGVSKGEISAQKDKHRFSFAIVIKFDKDRNIRPMHVHSFTTGRFVKRETSIYVRLEKTT